MPTFDQPGDVLHGACLCGAVAYRAQGPLFATSHCYCTMCQRQHGSVGSYGNVAVDGFVIVRGEALVTRYDKSPNGYCGFCGVCGAMLYWRGADTPHRVALALGCLAPAWTGTVEREWFTEHKPDWLPPA
jgi:hypothetical protein